MEDRPGLADLVVQLIYVAIGAWMMMSPQERYWVKLRLMGKAHQAASRLAWREGRKAMGDELRGRELARYPVALRLSQARDWIGSQLEEMRP